MMLEASVAVYANIAVVVAGLRRCGGVRGGVGGLGAGLVNSAFLVLRRVHSKVNG